MGEPRGAVGAGGVSCGGVFSLRGADLVSFCPLCPRPLLEGWLPQFAFDSQFTMVLGSLRAGELQRWRQLLGAETAFADEVSAREDSSVMTIRTGAVMRAQVVLSYGRFRPQKEVENEMRSRQRQLLKGHVG
jgi:hypothetical protein